MIPFTKPKLRSLLKVLRAGVGGHKKWRPWNILDCGQEIHRTRIINDRLEMPSFYIYQFDDNFKKLYI